MTDYSKRSFIEEETQLTILINPVNLAAAAVGGPHQDVDGNPDTRTEQQLRQAIMKPVEVGATPTAGVGPCCYFFENKGSALACINELTRRFPYLRFGDPSHPGGPIITHVIETTTPSSGTLSGYVLPTPFY